MQITVKLDDDQLRLLMTLFEEVSNKTVAKHVRKWHRRGG